MQKHDVRGGGKDNMNCRIHLQSHGVDDHT